MSICVGDVSFACMLCVCVDCLASCTRTITLVIFTCIAAIPLLCTSRKVGDALMSSVSKSARNSFHNGPGPRGSFAYYKQDVILFFIYM